KINLIDLERIRRQKAESEKAEEDRIREEQQKQKVEEKERQMAFDKAKAEKSKKDSISKMAQKSVDDLIQHYEKPSLMQITIVNASGWKKRADKLSVFLDKLQRKYIEESLGIKLDMVNVSDAKSAIHQQSTIFFKNNFLKSALFLAKLIPGEQKLAPMSMSARKERLGVDIMIFLGKDYK
ncbi:MAG: hypothetical protein GY866_10335, partial [Proteobacteria bacterium]|nr:hypothetical protein [Pseudomonadota bacterium]